MHMRKSYKQAKMFGYVTKLRFSKLLKPEHTFLPYLSQWGFVTLMASYFWRRHRRAGGRAWVRGRLRAAGSSRAGDGASGQEEAPPPNHLHGGPAGGARANLPENALPGRPSEGAARPQG